MSAAREIPEVAEVAEVVEVVEVVEVGGGQIAAGNSQRQWSRRRGWRVTIDGGVGEASPLPGVSRETHDEVGEALARALAGETVSFLPPSAAFAIDTARADAAARARGVSVAEILGAAPGAVASGSELGLAPSPACRCVKIKAGPAGAWPAQRRAVDRLLAARPELRVRVDFNGSLETSEAIAIAGELAELGWPLDFIEDPTAGEPPPLPVPVAVDAMLSRPGGVDAALAAAGRGVAAVAVLKPALLGGLVPAMAIARRLAAAGLVPIASHLLDGPIALAACAELACAIDSAIGRRGNPLAHGVGRHPGLLAYASGATPPETAVAIAQLDGPLLRPRPGGLC